jgi:hypothetical protein
MLSPQYSFGSATIVTVTALLAAELVPARSTATTTPSAGPDHHDEQLGLAMRDR